MLVLQSATLDEQGQLFVLDMGEPVRIADLARNLITLMGYTPGEDIDIEFTGLRPGEKMFEEVLTDAEGMSKTEFGKIFITQAEKPDWAEMESYIEHLNEAAKRGDADEIRRLLKDKIPDYTLPGEAGIDAD